MRCVDGWKSPYPWLVLLTGLLMAGMAGCGGRAIRAAAITARSVEVIKSGNAFIEAVTSGGKQAGK